MTPRQLIALRHAALKEAYRRDFTLYAKEQLWIQTKRAGVIENLDVNKKPLQQMVVRAAYKQFKEQGFVDLDIIKGRQQGSSTISQGMQFWKAANNKNYNTLLIAQDDPTTKAIFEKARFFFEHLHKSMQPSVRHSNRAELVFSNPDHKRQNIDHGLGSRMDFQSSTNMLAGTGTTRQGLHLSECAKYKESAINDLVASVYPCFHREPGAMRIKESTAFVGGQWFRECCDNARSRKTEEICIFAPWYLEPDNIAPLHPKHDRLLRTMSDLDDAEKHIVKVAKRGQKKDDIPPFTITPEQLKFRRITIAQAGWDEDLFLEEYPTEYDTAWISRDSRVFDHEKLHQMLRSQIRQPIEMAHIYPGPKIFADSNMRMHEELNYFAIWEHPIPGENYDIGVDVAMGVEGGDWSSAEVFKRSNHEQVAEYHIHLEPTDFGTQLFWLGLYYNGAQIAVEWTGGYGISTEGQLKRLNYPNLYLWRHRDQAAPIPTRKTGWQTSRESKSYLIGLFRHLIRHDRLTLRSRLLVNEMLDFIQIPWGDGFDYRAEHGYDDLIMGAGIGLVIGDDEKIGGDAETKVDVSHLTGFGSLGQVASQMMGAGLDTRDDDRMFREARGGFMDEIRGTR